MKTGYVRRRRHRGALLLVCIALSSLIATLAEAQPAFTVALGRGISSLGVPGAPSDMRPATTGTIAAEHQFASERVRLFYDLEAGSPVAGPEWHYFEHLAGVTVKLPLGTGSPLSLFLTPSVTWHSNGPAWSEADYRAIGGSANLEVHPSQTTTVRTGYRIDKRTFPSLAEMNQTEQGAFLSVHASFATRTTIIAEARVGRKSYEGAPGFEGAGYDAGSWPVTQAGGRGTGLGYRRPVVSSGSGDGSASASHQFAWFGRLAQSLTDRTGAWVQVAQRAAFGTPPPAIITTPPLYFDDGVYDDPFASDGLTVAANLKHHFAAGMVLEARVSKARKDYNTAVALDLDGIALSGSPLRRDWLNHASLSWTLPLLRELTGPVGLELGVGYAFDRHRSNDLFYNYTSHAVGLSIAVLY
jgi:hypothetical protein